MTGLRRAGFSLAALLVGLCLIGLGLWQIERRAWKHELIAAVESRTTAAPVAAPGPVEWAGLSRDKDAYRRITARGVFQHDKEVLVQAVTERGGGFWVMTPLDTGRFRIFINRGFVPPEKADAATRQSANRAGDVIVTGLLRITEPKGGFLRSNDPLGNRWFSRDISAMAKARSVQNAAPYFIDADASANAGGYPVGGMTVIAFNDHHMIYALTWFCLGLLTFYFSWRLWTSSRRTGKEAE